MTLKTIENDLGSARKNKLFQADKVKQEFWKIDAIPDSVKAPHC